MRLGDLFDSVKLLIKYANQIFTVEKALKVAKVAMLIMNANMCVAVCSQLKDHNHHKTACMVWLQLAIKLLLAIKP